MHSAYDAVVCYETQSVLSYCVIRKRNSGKNNGRGPKIFCTNGLDYLVYSRAFFKPKNSHRFNSHLLLLAPKSVNRKFIILTFFVIFL